MRGEARALLELLNRQGHGNYDTDLARRIVELERALDAPPATEGAVLDLLLSLGLDPTTPDLADTPKRAAAFWRDLMLGPNGDKSLDTSFAVEQGEQMIVVSGIEAWTVCEHHLLPFRLELAVGYIPAGRVLGLSKLARIAHEAAIGPNVQERVTRRTAEMLAAATQSGDVAVLARGEHLCMRMRGVRQAASVTSTSIMLGRFRESGKARAEFMALAGR